MLVSVQASAGLRALWADALGNDAEALAELQLLERMLGGSRPIVFLPELAYAYSRLGRRDDLHLMNLRMNFLADPRIEEPRFAETLSRIRGD